jgi:hypothetical protein
MLNAHSAVGRKVEGVRGEAGAVFVASRFRGAWGVRRGTTLEGVSMCACSVTSKVETNPVNSEEVKGISAKSG